MFDWQTVLEISRQNCEALKDPFAPGPAVTCTRTFTILPMRYAAVGGSAIHRGYLPTLPDHLRHPHRVTALQHADYAIRPLREGFLYVMEKRKSTGRHSLHPTYRVGPDGALSLIDPAHPDASPGRRPFEDIIRNTGWGFKVHDLDDVLELRLFYSPDRLTEAALERLQRSRDILPAVDIAPFANPICPAPRPHVLRHDQLELVADFAAESDDWLRKLLNSQVFNTPAASSLFAVRQALAPLGTRPEPRGVVVVVEDAIGITQELNAWRNAGIEHLKAWLQDSSEHVEGKPGPSNERKVLVAKAFTELHEQFTERKVGALVDRHKQAMRAYVEGSEQAVHPFAAEWWGQVKEGILDNAVELKRRDLQARAENGEFARDFEKRYLSRVNLQAMHGQLSQLEAHSLEAQRLAQARSIDHLIWLQSTQLSAALSFYDDDDLDSGVCFAHQTGLCVIGLESVPEGAQLLEQWWSADTVSPENLALRAFVFNQRSIAAVLEEARQKLDAPSDEDEWQPLDTALKQVKELATQFSRVDAHLAQMAQHNQLNTAGALVWLGQLGRQSVQASAPSSANRLLYRRLGAYLIASLGEQAVNLRLSEQMLDGHTPSPGRVAAPIVRRLDKAYVETLRGAHSHQFYQLRVASGLLLLEAGLLLLQGLEGDKDRRFWSEVAAGALASAAAGTELLAVGTEQTMRGVGRNSATARGAQISLGRYRLWGAGLAAMAGLVSIGWDASDAAEASARSKSVLATAYRTRALSTMALLIGQGGLAFSQASALFSWWALSASKESSAITLTSLSNLSTKLATNRAAMVFLSRLSWMGGALVITSSFTLLIIDEDLLEKWCSRCSFRAQLSNKGYSSDAEEFEALLNAISEII